MSMRANGDLTSSSVGNDAERVAVGKDISQSNQDVTVNFGIDTDNLAVRLNFLASEMEDLRVEFAALNEKHTQAVSKYTEAMVNDIKLSIALGVLLVIMMIVFYRLGGIVLSLHDDMIRLTAQVQRIHASESVQEASSR